jgi:hypothetical protein
MLPFVQNNFKSAAAIGLASKVDVLMAQGQFPVAPCSLQNAHSGRADGPH